MTPSILTIEAVRAEAQPWPKPRALARAASPALDFAKCIPPGLAPFRDFCAAVAESLQVPPDAVAPLALSIVAGTLGRSIETRVSADWTETESLWFAVLMEAGERKSALVSLLSRPLTDWQTAEAEHLRGPLASYAERRRCVSAELDHVRGVLSKTKHGTPERDEATARVIDLADELDRLPLLGLPCLTVADMTPEALRDQLRANGEKALWLAPEVDAAALLGSRHSKAGPNIDLFLKAFSGDAAPAHRVGRDVSLQRPALSLALCVQPAAVAEVLRDGYAKDRGLVPRLCLISPRSTLGGRRLNPDPVPPDLLQWWGDTLRGLLALPWPGRVIVEGGIPSPYTGEPRTLTLSGEARIVLDALRLDIEPRLAEAGDLRGIAAFASKLPGVCVRIAAAFALLEDSTSERITGPTMRAAVAWAPYLIASFTAALGAAAEPAEVKVARRLLDTLKRHQLAELSERDALRHLDGNGLKLDELKPALELLIEGEWLRDVPPPLALPGAAKGGRPPSPRYEVNPAALLVA